MSIFNKLHHTSHTVYTKVYCSFLFKDVASLEWKNVSKKLLGQVLVQLHNVRLHDVIVTERDVT
jgi:hypothetical protein